MSDRWDTLAALSEEGLAACKNRGHLMRFQGNIQSGREGGLGRRYACVRCGAEVDIQTKPMPNEYDLMGDALALNCPKEY